MKITPALLWECYECQQSLCETWAPHLDRAADRYQINTPARLSTFLAQIGHESGRLRYVVEIWGPTRYQERYEGRKDLGNIKRGDGYRFRGRGLIQVTGRANYREIGRYLGLPLEDQPELLEQPEHAASSAAAFWQVRGLNALADSGHFDLITRRINGGFNGHAERQKLYQRCVGVMNSHGKLTLPESI